MVKVKRVYDKPSTLDGRRILVDRLWPRGLKRERAGLSDWNKAVAPSSQLRSWFGHDPSRFDAFRQRYLDELADNPAATELKRLSKRTTVTLLYAAKDVDHNHALVLKEFLDS